MDVHDQGETMLMTVVHAATQDRVDVHDRGDHVDDRGPCCHWLLWARKLYLFGVDISGRRFITEKEKHRRLLWQ